MNISRIFILRPIATSLLMVALLLSGLLAGAYLPVSALPQIDYPTIQVQTLYPGASPDVMSAVVTAPLERQFGIMSGLSQMTSLSSAGASVITLQFDLSVPLDVAEQEVQAAINAASNLLPNDLPNPPVYNKVNPADPPIVTLAATSSAIPLTKLEDLVDTRLAQKISQLPGVGLVTLSGGQRPAVRIQANPRALAAQGLTLADVRSAIASANVNGAKGSFDGPLRASTIDANDQLASAEEYARTIIGYKNGAPIRLQDVAEVVDGAENIRLAAWVAAREADGSKIFSPAIVLSVQRQPGANVIKVADSVIALLPQLKETLPGNMEVRVITDRTVTIRATVHDVELELALSILLVVFVIWLFLRNGRATIIPALAVPLSITGALGVMYLADYSLNNLTLMALVIATGFVVDDAIVVIENIMRYMEAGDKPLKAALTGAGQIGFTIISLTISLVAVLIPLLFMGDVVGRLFREFAVTLAVTILVSAVISLTLTPMLCAILLRDGKTPETGKFFQGVLSWYDRRLQWVFAHQFFMLCVAAGTVILTVVLYIIVPKGFFPVQDTGILQGIAEAPQDTSFEGMAKRQKELAEELLDDKDVEDALFFVGVDGINQTVATSRFTVALTPLADRSLRAPVIADRIMTRMDAIPGQKIFIQPVQDLTIEDRVSRTQYQFSVEALSQEQLAEWLPRIMAALEKQPELTRIASDFQSPGRMAWIDINRDAASRLGVTMTDIDNALYDALGQRLISTIFTQTNQYKVVLETAPRFRAKPEDLENIFVGKNAVPLTSMATISERPVQLSIARQGQFPVATISFNTAPGYSLSAAVQAVLTAEQGIGLPAALRTQFQGAARAYAASATNQVWLILAAIVTMYIVLGVLYESYVHPLTILSTLPSAGIGALLALMLAHMELGVVGIIGIILLIGIVKKNAIMMIDFALEAEREQGKTALEAIHQACLLRLRPILMTTLAALLGALPLMLGWGMGAELRRPLGVTMVGGLLVSQALTLFTTPVIYLWFDRLVTTKRHADTLEKKQPERMFHV